MKVKRTAENQIAKDNYDDDRHASGEDPGRGMERADPDVIGRRKILKVSRRKFGGGEAQAASTAPVPSTQPSTKPTNPFAGASFGQPSQPTATSTLPYKSDGEPPSKPNPFANVAFASSTPAAKPTFSFGSSAAPAQSTISAPKPAAASFSFGSTASSKPSPSPLNLSFSAAGTTQTVSLTTPKASSQKSTRDKARDLNKDFLQSIVDQWDSGNVAGDYSAIMVNYQQLAEGYDNELDDSEGNGPHGDGKHEDGSHGEGGSSYSVGTSTNANSSFSFGSSAPAPSTSSIPFASFGTAAPSPDAPAAGTFSFGSTSSSAAPSTSNNSAPSFSFGNIPPPSSTGSSFNDGAANNDDDPTSNPDDGKIEKVEQEENTEEEILTEVRAKPMKREKSSGEWKKFGSGACRLYRHKTTSKHRLVIRNQIGKVQFNVAVSNKMEFTKEIKDTKKGKLAFVKFMGVMDASEGPVVIVLQVQPEKIDEFHSQLEGLSS